MRAIVADLGTMTLIMPRARGSRARTALRADLPIDRTRARRPSEDRPRRDPERVLRAAGPAVPDGRLRAARRAVSRAGPRRRDVAHGALGARVPRPRARALRVGP